MTVRFDEEPFAEELAAFGITPDEQQWGEVYLGEKAIPTLAVTETNLGTLAAKFTIGESNKDSDNLLSVWIQNDWTGGGQAEDLNELSQGQRFRHADGLDTYHPNMLSLNLETTSYTITSAMSCFPIGDYKPSGGRQRFWVAFDLKLCYWDKDTTAFIHAADLPAVPVNKGVIYDGLLWIPLGASGYSTWNGTSVVNSSSSPDDPPILPVSLKIWDNKIAALSISGQYSLWDGFAWTSNPALQVRDGSTMRNLVVWWDQNRESTVYIITDGGVYSVDPLVPTLYTTGDYWPTHPDQGLASAQWRDDSMYVSIGVGIQNLSLGGVITFTNGLDRDDGLPTYLRGAIVDFEPEYNGMYALVQGIVGAIDSGDEDNGDLLEETQVYDTPIVASTSSGTAYSSLQLWTGVGWHNMWQSDAALGTATRVMVSQADGEYQVWWGYGASMYRQLLRRTAYNPKQGVEIGTDRFSMTGYLYSGRFDANMPMFIKLGSHVEAHLDPLSQGQVDVYYQTDATYPSWVRLGGAYQPGTTVLKFKSVDGKSGSFSKGESFRWIEFQYVLSSTNVNLSPVVMWFTLKMIKLPLETLSWSFVVPLVWNENWQGSGAQEMHDYINDLVKAQEFTSFGHADRYYRVRVAQVTFNGATGKDKRGTMRVNLVQIDPDDEALDFVEGN